ncbi:MAG TPA: Maf family nucleotide pyrophosphatase [Burkholderiaceae bacterium]|nr:Maf family nucleotide pyrophosphatase [Burkholderiaceae bacterium]
MPASIVLASSSPYRRQLLERLRLPFDVEAPDIDEAGHAGETPLQQAQRLALLKASSVSARRPEAIVIGSDQVAALDGVAIGKPLDHPNALRQLLQMQGRSVLFHTALAVVRRADAHSELDCVDTLVRFRRLTREALEAYLRIEQPYDCAGSAKIESLGICLVESVQSDDPSALIGLPLIRLTSMLAGCGVALPQN